MDRALVAVAADLLALTLLTPPGNGVLTSRWARRSASGCRLGYGGPHPGFIATKYEYVRGLPGRLVGVSHDTSGRIGYRLALQTREQHIRREKATSNVCTAQVLLAVIAGFYACWHGQIGLKEIAKETHTGSPRWPPNRCKQRDTSWSTSPGSTRSRRSPRAGLQSRSPGHRSRDQPRSGGR